MPTLENTLAQVETLPVALVQRFLAYKGYAGFTLTSRDRLMKKLRGMIDRAELGVVELQEMLVDFRESGDKRTYLFSVTPAVRAAVNTNALPAQIASLADAPFNDGGSGARHVYSLVTTNRIRFAFSERHWRYEADYGAETLTRVPVTKRIVFDLERQTGNASLSLDPPGHSHPHASTLAYHNHYRSKTEALLGGPLVALSLHGALEELEAADLTSIKYLAGRSADAATFTVAADTEVRGTIPYAKAAGDMVERSRARFHWKMGKTCNTGRGPISLSREVRTDVDADAGLVKFMSQTTSHEVDYVLAQLRAHA